MKLTYILLESMPKEYKEIIRELERQGWRLVRGTRHWKAFPPDKKKPMVTIPGTPSDYRSIKNTIAQLRRSGFIWPPPD